MATVHLSGFSLNVIAKEGPSLALLNTIFWDFPGGLASGYNFTFQGRSCGFDTCGFDPWLPGEPRYHMPRGQNTKTYNRNNIVTNSIVNKDFENGSHQKVLKKKKGNPIQKKKTNTKLTIFSPKVWFISFISFIIR